MNPYVIIVAVFGMLLLINLIPDAEDKEEYCYAPYGGPVVAEHEATEVNLSVTWSHGSRASYAQAAWFVREDGTVDCEIFVPRPHQVLGDPDMDSIGHEVLHCLIGSFHEEIK